MTSQVHAALRTVAIAAVALALPPSAVVAQVNVIYGNPSSPVTGIKFEVAVLADGYSSSAQFDQDAKNLINYGLMADPFYASLGSHFVFTTVFQPTVPPETSLFGLTITGSIANCYLQTKPDTASTIFTAMTDKVPAARHALVLKNDSSTIGCTKNNWWTVVSSGNVNTTGALEHEFGHLVARLHDEYVIDPGRYPTPPLYGPNCTTDVSKAWWNNVPIQARISPPVNREGCKLYGSKIFRPYADCRMRQMAAQFCPVCSFEMFAALNWMPGRTPTIGSMHGPPLAVAAEMRRPRIVPAAYVIQPPPQPPGRPSVRVLITLTTDSVGRITKAHAERATDVGAPAPQNYRRMGDYIYEIKVGGTTKETGFLAGDPFEERAYGQQTVPHRTSTTTTATVVVSIPDGRKVDYAPLRVEINFYRLVVDTRYDLDPTAFARLKPAERVAIGSVSAADLHEALRRE